MKSVPIRELFKIRGGKPAPKGKDAFTESGIPFVKMKDLGRAHFSNDLTDIRQSVSDEVARSNKLNLIKRGAILLPRSGSVALNHRAILGVDAYIVSHICALEVIDTGKLDTPYAYYYLRSIRMDRISKKTTGLDAITFEDLGRIPIPLPPLPEQRRIAAILDKAESLLALRRRALEELEMLPQTMFVEMFGDPVRNERGWELAKLSQMGVLERGVSKHRPRNDPKLLGGRYPLIQTGDIAKSNGYISEFTQTYSELGIRQSKMWPAGTLCITIAANIAKTGRLMFDACFPDSVVGFSSENQSTIEFVRVWFLFFQKLIEEKAPVSAQKNINLRLLRELYVIAPPLHLQQEFARRIETVEKLRERNRASLAAMETLFEALQQKAFSGKL